MNQFRKCKDTIFCFRISKIFINKNAGLSPPSVVYCVLPSKGGNTHGKDYD